MKRFLCVILVFWISCYAFGQITQTLILDSTALDSLRTSLGGADPFLAQSMSSTYGPYRIDDIDLRDYGILTSVSGMANQLQDALFSANQADVVGDVNTALNGLTWDYNDFRDYYLSYISTHNGVTETTEAWARSLKLCYLTEDASSIFDAFYYSASSTNLNKLRTIITSCVELIDYIKAKYDSLSVSVPPNRYYWGIAKNRFPDFEENGNDVYLPEFSTIQLKLLNCTAWGYGALVLKKDAQINAYALTESKMNQYLSEIDSMLTSINYPQFADFQRQGLLAFHTNNSGGYIESLGYLDMVMTMSSPFFTTSARMGGVNYFNNNYIMGWIEDAINKTTPYLGDWAYNDTNYRGYGNVKYLTQSGSEFLTNSILNGIAEFFYNNTNNATLRNKCAGYIHCRKIGTNYPGIIYLGPYNNFLMLYNSNPARNLGTATDYPDGIKNGTWSNSEFTVLKKTPLNTTLSEELVNNPSMYITHKNSMNCDHNQADQTSYSFFYRGKQFLIDPGYNNKYKGWNYGRVWMHSPYAHNMIIVNPLENNERNEILEGYISFDNDTYNEYRNFISTGNDDLRSYRPSCTPYSAYPSTAAELFKSPAYKIYLSQNFETDMLQTFLRYDYSDPIVSDYNPFYVDLTRTYIRDGGLFFVYDDLISLATTDKIYWNLLQMGFSNDPDGLSSIVDSRFSLTKGSTSSSSSYVASIDCVDFASGSNLLFSNTIDDVNNVVGGVPYRLPMDNLILEYKGGDSSAGGADNQPHPGIDHKRIRTVVNGVNPKFLTVIAPREHYDDDQLITQTINTPVGHYGTSINSKSHTYNPTTHQFDPSTTYSGCSNGSIISAEYSTICSINTDAKFYLLTRPNNASTDSDVDNSLVIIDGTFINVNINVNSTPVYKCNTPGILSMNASYLSDALHVEFHATSAIRPRFKISRCGINPWELTARLSYSSVLPPSSPVSQTNPYPQSTPTNIIDRIAYDDNYLYVNFSIDDLIAEGICNEDHADLFIFSGSYSDINSPALLQFRGPNFSLSGDWFVPHGSILRMLGNTSMTISPDFNINVDGFLDIIGTQDNICNIVPSNTSQYWDGINVSYDGQINLEYCQIIMPGVINVYGTIKSLYAIIDSSNFGLRLHSVQQYCIEYTTIANGAYLGILFNDCVRDAEGNHFVHNQIINNLYGIALFNSSPLIESSIITDNEKAGIICTYNSNPVVKGCSIFNTFLHNMQNIPGFYNPESPEVILYGDCFPVLHQNDIIFNEGYSLLLFDQYPDPEPGLECQENYWGTTGEYMDFIRQSFYPPSWNVMYEPILEQTIHDNPNGNPLIASYFNTALYYEETNDFITARSIYKSIIENYPNNSEAEAAASRLVCIADTEEELQLAADYLDGIYELYPSTKLANGAYLDVLLCERLLKDYQSAIDGYLDKLQNCTDYMDSLLTTLDIIYTYLEADANNYRAVIPACQVMGVTLTSAKQAKQIGNSILDIVMNRPIPGEQTFHIPDVITTTNNYPNPFNPTTTIMFSTPKTSKCELVVYNIKGQAVRHLLSDTKSKGIYKTVWNSDDDNGKRVSSGVYFYRLNIDGHITTKKMLLMK